MKLKKIFTEKNIALDFEFDNAIEAIKKGGDLLFESGITTEIYTDEMIKSYKKLGAYMVISPGIAVPHARPNYGVLKTGISFIRLKTPIYFGNKENDPVKLIFCIAGATNDNHIEIIQSLSEILFDKKLMEKIINSKTKGEFLSLFD